MTTYDPKYDPFTTSGATRLPFPVMYAEWFNGKAGYDATKYEVSHFGGWYIQADKVDDILAEVNRPMLSNFPLVKMYGSSGEFQAYASRTITVAPIIKRVGWFTNDNGNEYSSLQLLAWASIPNAKTRVFEAWGPVILKAKSLTGVSVMNALHNWSKKITPLLPQDNTQPAWAHWVTLGTLRPEIFTEKRGKGKATSLATPCEFYTVSENMDAFVKGRYIGDTLRDELEEVRDQTLEWASNWDKYNRGRAGAQADEEGVSDLRTGSDVQPPDNFDSDLPF